MTVEDVQRVIGKYLKKENRAVAIYTRKASSGATGEDPDLAGLSPDQLPVIRKVMSSIQAETNLEKLKANLSALEAQGASADPKRHQFQKLIQKKVAERIATLEKK